MNIDQSLNNKILVILKSSKRPFAIIQNDDCLMEYINSNTPLLVKNGNSIQTKLYWLFNNITEFPVCQNEKCENFGKPIKKNVYSLYDGYSATHDPHVHCNNKCAQLDKHTISRVKQTKLNHYGNENFSNPQKSKQTCLNRYGVTHTSKLKENRKKAAQTNLSNHNGHFYFNPEKASATHFKNTGYTHQMRNPNVIAKIIESNLKHLGVRWPAQSKEVIKKQQETLFKNYGVTCSFNIPGLREKIMLDRFIRTGFYYPSSNPEIQRKAKKRYQYNGVHFDSTWELALYIYCTDHQIQCQRIPDITFNYADPITNQNKRYVPDFEINGKIFEIKGDQFFKEDGTMQNPYNHNLDATFEAKHQCMIKNGVIILRQNDIQKYLDYITQTYGRNYLLSFKNL